MSSAHVPYGELLRADLALVARLEAAGRLRGLTRAAAVWALRLARAEERREAAARRQTPPASGGTPA